MANWLHHYVCFIDKENPESNALAKQVREYLMKGNEVSFNKIFPIPQELHTVNSGSISSSVNIFIKKHADYEQDFDSMVRTDSPELAKNFTSHYKEYIHDIRRYFELYKKYGYTDWYEARCALWGTGYDASDTEPTDEGVNFYTKWSIPTKIFEHLVQKFPSLIIEDTYYDEGDFFVHTFRYEWSDGKLVRAILMPDEDYTEFTKTAETEKKTLKDLATECMGIIVSRIYPVGNFMAFSE